jgi:hypothetical protein
MKWYNKKQTVCLDLDRVAYWSYTSQEEIDDYKIKQKKMREQDPSAFMVSPLENTQIEIYISGGGPLIFNGEDADQIYKMLTSERKIL